MKKLFLPVLFLFISISAFAQSKVGTIDSDLIIGSMTELEQVQKDMETYGAELDKQFNEMVTEYQAEVKAFQSLDQATPEADLKTKQEEIIGLEQNIQKFRQNSQQLIQIKQNELMQPLYTKVGQALDAVAKEQGYSQVLTLNAGVGYFDPAYDLTQAVATKLGVTLKE